MNEVALGKGVGLCKGEKRREVEGTKVRKNEAAFRTLTARSLLESRTQVGKSQERVRQGKLHMAYQGV